MGSQKFFVALDNGATATITRHVREHARERT